MTHSQSSTAKAPRQPNKLAGEGGCHAYVEDGELYIMDGGKFWLFDRDRAWAEWFWCASSPIPSTQERARQIRAAMDEAYPDQRIAA